MGKKSDVVKCEVLIGTLQWEKGIFQKGDVFKASRERAEQFDSTSVKILTEEPAEAKEEAKETPIPPETFEAKEPSEESKVDFGTSAEEVVKKATKKTKRKKAKASA